MCSRSGSRTDLKILLIPLIFLIPLSADADWDEATDGDLSWNPNAPTAVTMSVGSNVIQGSVSTGAGDTRDYITFTIAEGQALVALNQLSYVDIPGGGPGNRGFHSINLGSTSFIPSASTASSFLGGNHLDAETPGTDLLPSLATAPQAGTGFAIPLGPGQYSYLIQQGGPQTSGYSMEFVVESTVAVPLLTPLAMGVLAALLLGSTWVMLRKVPRSRA